MASQIVSYGLPWFQIWGCRLRCLDLEQRHFEFRGHVFVMIDDGSGMKADMVWALGLRTLGGTPNGDP